MTAVWICNASRNNARFVHLEGVNIRYDSGSGVLLEINTCVPLPGSYVPHVSVPFGLSRYVNMDMFWSCLNSCRYVHWVDYVLAVVKAVLCECVKAIDPA